MTDPLNEPTLAQLRQRASMKWRRYPDDVLPLWVAEMDATPVPAVAEVVTDAMARGDTGYPVPRPYLEALAAFAEERWGWRMDPAQARIVPDVMLGIVEVLGLVTRPGEAVIVNPPVYPPFFAFIEHAGRRVVEAPLGEDHRLDLDVLDRAMGEATRHGGRAAYLLCSPHNPTGTVHSVEELSAVARLATRHGVRVVVDEIHAPLVQPGARHVPYLAVAGTEEGFALLSASKAWNLAGLKAAVAVPGQAAASELATLPEIVGHGASHLAVLAHTAALRHGGDWLDAVLQSLAANQRLLARLLDEHLPEVRYEPAPATYLAWLDARGLELGDDPGKAFLRRGRVALHPGQDFGTGGAGHVRLNLATSQAVLTEAVERMASVVRPRSPGA